MGGLTLARILQKHGARPTVYEREQSSSSREQQGSLDLHPESGLTAMRAAELFDEFKKFARYEGEQARILDKNCVLHFDAQEAMGPPSDTAEEPLVGRPEIDR